MTLERATAEHGAIDIRPHPDALRADVNPGLCQQKHQKPEIDDGENDQQSLSLHGHSSRADLSGVGNSGRTGILRPAHARPLRVYSHSEEDATQTALKYRKMIGRRIHGIIGGAEGALPR